MPESARKSYAIFSAFYPPHMGGIENFTENLAHELERQGAHVTVVTNDTEGMDCGIEHQGKIEIVRLPCFPLLSGRFPLPKRNSRYRRLIHHLKLSHWDGVLVNARFYPHSLLGMKLARKKGLTPIVLDHGSAALSFGSGIVDQLVWFYEKSITQYGLKKYNPAYYGISQKSAEWLRTFGIHAKGVITNAIDANQFRDLASQRVFHSETDPYKRKLLVAFLGRLIPEKGVIQLIDAMSLLNSRRIHLVIAGSGPLEQQIISIASKVNNIDFVGRLDRCDTSALLREADVLCLPTRSEGLPTVMLEAAACGCALIMTETGGAQELIPAPEHGIVLKEDSPKEIAKALTELSQDTEKLKKLKHTAAQHVRDSFSWKRTAERLINIFEHHE